MSPDPHRRHQRPIYLNVHPLRLPLGAVVSIVHRFAGVMLFLVLPLLLAVWQKSLDIMGFAQLGRYASEWHGAAVVLFFLLGWHAAAGLRIMWLEWRGGAPIGLLRSTAWLVVLLALAAASGGLLWL